MIGKLFNRFSRGPSNTRTEIASQSDTVVYKNTVLPRRDLRYGGIKFQSDAYFLAAAEAEADRLVEKFGLTVNTSVLDVGCGVGRLAIGLIRRLSEIRHYRGVDVSARAISWCEKHIASNRVGFEFRRIDVMNERYNPKGRGLTEEFRLPYENGEFDIIYLYSVFSHMTEGDVSVYLKEFNRLLAPDGRTFCTAFVEEGVPKVTLNPDNYRMAWKGALHCVRYDKRFFCDVLEHHGFRVDGFDYATEFDGQSAFYLSKKR